MPAIDSILIEETETMEQRRRAIEKARHRARLGIKVEEPDHPEKQKRQEASLEGGRQHQIKENPWLKDRQDLDGTPPDMSARPTLNSYALAEFDNLVREQELEYKLRMGLINAPSSAPKPRGPQ